MSASLGNLLGVLSIATGLVSAVCWFRGSTFKVDHKNAMAQRIRDARRNGEVPNLASVSFDGWDVSGTLSGQAKWNALGALFAGCSIASQAFSQLVEKLG